MKSLPGIAMPLLGTVLLSMTLTAAANTGETATKRCLPVQTIKRTQIIDDQNILFYTRDHKIYNNHLPYTCAGLAAAHLFKYATSQSQLCNVDTITILLQTGSSYMVGASCGLGMFEPATDPDTANRKK